jgi:hypothetical protein
MSSSNSSEIEDQITTVFSDVINEAMSIVQVEEAAASVVSSSI